MTDLIVGFERSHIIAWRQGAPISQSEFLADVLHTAGSLPAGEFMINLCADRYNFLVAFAATVVCGKTCLFPNSTAPAALAQIAEGYSGASALYDRCVPSLGIPAMWVNCWDHRAPDLDTVPSVPLDRTVVHAFTSGSTGTPQMTAKTWGALVAGAKELERRAPVPLAQNRSIVATVPPGHSYGMETTIIPALLSGAAIECGQPLFAADVGTALDRVPRPRCLVTTPIHLRALVSSSVIFPAVDLVMCATAPLPIELARRAEARFGARILEIYGCTESGWIASRWTTDGVGWTLRDDMQLTRAGEGHAITAQFLAAPVPLADIIEQVSDNTFTVIGRSADMVNIGGKRASLSGLTHLLTGIDGVEDGVVLMPEGDDSGVVGRPIAVVVAPGLSRDKVRLAFRECVDPVFVPRHVIKVDALPRNETGKLPLDRLKALVKQAIPVRQ